MKKRKIIKRTIQAACLCLITYIIGLFLVASQTIDNSLPFKAMPQSCDIISEHRDLSSVWDIRLHSKLAQNIFNIFGGDLESLQKDRGLKYIITFFSGHESVIGYSIKDDTTYMASPCGIREPLIKLFLAFYGNELKIKNSPYSYSFSIKDHTLLCVYTRTPTNLSKMEEAISKKNMPNIVFTNEPFSEPNVTHRAWLPSIHPQYGGLIISPIFTESSTIQIQITPQNEIPTQNLTYPISATAYSADRSLLTLLLPPQILPIPTSANSTQGATLFLNGGPLSTKIMGINLPTITAIIPNTQITLKEAQTILRTYLPNVKLSPPKTNDQDYSFTIKIDNPYISSLEPIVSYSALSQTLTICSSAISLKKLQSPSTLPVNPSSITPTLPQNEKLIARLWLDPTTYREDFERIFSLYFLLTTFTPNLPTLTPIRDFLFSHPHIEISITSQGPNFYLQIQTEK